MMPTYEYACLACGREYEFVQRITDDPHRVCPECGGRLQRLIAGTSFRLVGNGWAKDGYAPKPPAKGSGSGSGSGKGS